MSSSAASKVGGLPASFFASLGSDTTLGNDPTYTDLATITVSGALKYLVTAQVAGINSNDGATMRIRVQTDGSTVGGQGAYSTTSGGNGGATQATVAFVATVGDTGSHTFKLQGSWGGSSITVHAATNPNLESATIAAVQVN